MQMVYGVGKICGKGKAEGNLTLNIVSILQNRCWFRCIDINFSFIYWFFSSGFCHNINYQAEINSVSNF